MPISRLVLLAGVLVAAALGALAVVATLRQSWVLVALAASTTAGLILVVQLDTWRRTRSLRNFLRDEIRRGVPAVRGGARPMSAGPMTEAPPVTHEDVLGAVRVMQAQYTGRLDRMQTTLDRALAELSRTDGAGREP